MWFLLLAAVNHAAMNMGANISPALLPMLLDVHPEVGHPGFANAGLLI